ncbi:adenylate kinase [bacterium]|nr:MAG: adenylate kinase [bacterium]
MRIVLLGPPGSGKGTQAVKVAAKLEAVHIATGDLFRTEIEAETELGLLANEYIAHGNLVPNEVTNAMMKERLARPDADSFVLDGYPRTLDQASALEEMLTHLGKPLDGAFLIDVPDESIVERAVGRLLCKSCGAIYHLKFKPPQVAGICDVCRGILSVREDDTPSTVRHRLTVYHRITTPVLAFYEERDLLTRVNGVGTPQEIYDRLVAVLFQA